jgi:hypothetical protein
MRLCDFVLAADDSLDLADPASATRWLQERPWWVHAGLDADEGTRPVCPFLSEAGRRRWRLCVWTLRSMARRLGRRKVRREAPSDAAALYAMDELFKDHLERMRLAVVTREPPRRKQSLAGADALNAATFAGVTLGPTWEGPNGERHPVPLPLVDRYLHDLDVFWQCTFYSLVMTAALPVCSECGRPLEATSPTGRPTRQQVCDACRWKRWRRKQSTRKMRSKWKEDKRNQRG